MYRQVSGFLEGGVTFTGYLENGLIQAMLCEQRTGVVWAQDLLESDVTITVG